VRRSSRARRGCLRSTLLCASTTSTAHRDIVASLPECLDLALELGRHPRVSSVEPSSITRHSIGGRVWPRMLSVASATYAEPLWTGTTARTSLATVMLARRVDQIPSPAGASVVHAITDAGPHAYFGTLIESGSLARKPLCVGCRIQGFTAASMASRLRGALRPVAVRHMTRHEARRWYPWRRSVLAVLHLADGRETANHV
jgi:hypothetical protein